MIPKTRDEALVHKYGVSDINPQGTRYNPERCAYEVWKGWTSRQCRNKPHTGPSGLYCKTHAKIVCGCVLCVVWCVCG